MDYKKIKNDNDNDNNKYKFVKVFKLINKFSDKEEIIEKKNYSKIKIIKRKFL